MGILTSVAAGLVMALLTFFHGDFSRHLLPPTPEVVAASPQLSEGLCHRLHAHSLSLLLHRLLQWL